MCKRARNLFRSKVVDDDDPHKTEKKGNYFSQKYFRIRTNAREKSQIPKWFSRQPKMTTLKFLFLLLFHNFIF